ncbi:TRAP transporter permease [Marinivivus vitaminiproducens]|uniref:TRAP transporter permease n=1 Tax=Marinivivus vitaminiproducens TaxID=3035935 RepID=UPI00279A53F0|nr:TRAP transporter permease [Geminicoccaceae bacterium SCSIO 64248]
MSERAPDDRLPPDAALQAPDPAVLDAAAADHGLPGGFGEGWLGRIVFSIAIAFSTFQLYTAAFPNFPSQVVRAVHVGFLLLLGFSLIANLKTPSRNGQILLWTLGILGFATGLYQWIFYRDLILRAGGYLEPQDLVVGVILIALVFEGTRRIMGAPLAIIALLFLLYGAFGEYLPAPFGHRGYDWDQLIDHLAFGTEGIYGTPVYVSSSYIFLFILFGSFLERAGMIQLFNDIALGMVGHTRGGPAKVAVVSSALMGTISGSGVANVVTTGQFTIPLMKRFGYRAAFAGGVEATASMGGQIMPPVMGAVAFIMAETLNVPYAEVVKAAIIPALLYFGSAFWMVHLEAGKRNLLGLKPDQLPSALGAIKAQWFLLIPLVVLVYLLFSGYTPLFAGTMGLALTAVLILGGAAVQGVPSGVLRLLFWILLGLVCAAFFRYGVNVIVWTLVALVAIVFFVKGGRETLLACRDALADGAKNALPVGIACAMVGVIIGTLTLTGAATTFAGFIVRLGETSLLLSLGLTMLVCLVLGMGIPTIPNYIITSSIAGPALLELGVPLMVSHMFVFYFGIMADLTPPVALAAFAAAPIAKESGMKIGMQALKIALAGFVVPYMAVYTPALMLQDGGPLAAAIGYWPAVLYIVLKAVISVVLWGAAAIGFLFAPIAWWERILATAAAFSLVLALPVTDEIGFGLTVAVVGQHLWRTRRAPAVSAG